MYYYMSGPSWWLEQGWLQKGDDAPRAENCHKHKSRQLSYAKVVHHFNEPIPSWLQNRFFPF